MQTPPKTKVKLTAASSLLFWIPLIIFIGIANEVSELEPLPSDVAILNYIHANVSAGLAGLFLLVTNLGNVMGITIITGLFVALLAYRRRFTDIAVLLVGVIGAAIANVVMKLLFKRGRPSLWASVVQEQSFSFPSGHAMGSSALVFFLMYIAWHTRFRWPAIILGSMFMLSVGFSRLYFGVHYPSDVLAGWLASFLWVIIVVIVLTTSKFEDTLNKLTHKLKH
jgi:membrane-associated phospholipid phosphatase